MQIQHALYIQISSAYLHLHSQKVQGNETPWVIHIIAPIAKMGIRKDDLWGHIILQSNLKMCSIPLSPKTLPHAPFPPDFHCPAPKSL